MKKLSNSLAPSTREADQVNGDTLERRREEHCGKTSLAPNHHQDQKQVIPGLEREPRLRRKAPTGDHRIERPDLRLTLRSEGVDKAPDYRSADQRYRHGHKDDGFGDRLKAAAVGKHSNQEAQADAEEGADEQPKKVVAERFKHRAVGEGGEIVVQADELG